MRVRVGGIVVGLKKGCESCSDGIRRDIHLELNDWDLSQGHIFLIVKAGVALFARREDDCNYCRHACDGRSCSTRVSPCTPFSSGRDTCTINQQLAGTPVDATDREVWSVGNPGQWQTGISQPRDLPATKISRLTALLPLDAHLSRNSRHKNY